ncbi:MAG: hypothetical protein ABIS86_00545, partial [Streptosporangiaceae bacterium]
MKRRLVVVGGAAPLLGAALIPMGQDLALAQGLTLAQSRAACPVAGVAAVPEPVPLVPSASGSRSAAASPKLAVSVQGRQHDALVDYRIVARNTGTAPAKNVVVTVRLLCAPPGIAPVSRPVATAGGISAGPDSMIWRLDLAGGTGSTAGARYSVPAPGGTLTTRVTATGAASNCPG